MPLLDISLALLVVLLVLQVVILLRGRGDTGLHTRLDGLKDDLRHLREALAQEHRAGRSELSQALVQFGQRLDVLTERTDGGMQALSQRLIEEARRGREELAATLNQLGDQQKQQLATLTADNEKRLAEVRTTLETKLGAIQQDNAAKLEQMRATVEEKLQSTWKRALANRSSWCPNDWKRCIAAWAKCSRSPTAWAISSVC